MRIERDEARNKKTVMKSRRAVAILMTLALLFVMFFSNIYIAHDGDHDCDGEDCPVCALLQASANNLRQMGSGSITAPASTLLVFVVLVMLRSIIFDVAISTPVSRKIRLNN